MYLSQWAGIMNMPACVLSCLSHPITASMYSTMESKKVGVMYTAPSKEATMVTVIAYNTN